MYKPLPASETEAVDVPDRSLQLWRYVDVPRYLSLLARHELWFSRADSLEDSHEGALTTPMIEFVQRQLLMKVAKDMLPMLRRHAYLCCWHASDFESAAMWDRQAGEGPRVAIRTTTGQLMDSLLGDHPVHVGIVNYPNFATDEFELAGAAGAWNLFFHKRASFSFEQEVRAICFPFGRAGGDRDAGRDNPPGVYVGVNLERLVGGVLVDPRCDDWVCEGIAATTSAFGFAWPVTKSDLYGPPLV